MNYQNDTNLSTENKRTEPLLSDRNTLNYKSFLDFALKKTEKLVMALYMVTDGVDMDEALGKKVRLLAVDLMSDIHHISSLYKTQKSLSIISTQGKITEILSFVGIGETIGFISEMNASILKNEFTLLSEELVRFEAENKSKSMSLSEDSKTVTDRFVIDRESLFVSLPTYQSAPQLPNLTDTGYYKRHIKDRDKDNVLYKKERPLSKEKDTKVHVSREERRKQILNFLKDKHFVSIKDISESITDCSEKTLQRELNELVSQDKVSKEGEKRWSRYKYKNFSSNPNLAV